MFQQILSFTSALKSVGGVVLAVAILLVMVTIHEFGHYVAGKILHFKITEFSIGFGPAIFKKRSKKTGELFALRIVPLGGYCAFDGEDDMDEAPFEKTSDPFEETSETGEEQNDGGRGASNEEYPEPQGERFNDQKPWKRIIVLVAGATMNYLLALVLIVTMFACIGRPVYTVMEKPQEGESEAVSAVLPTEEDFFLQPGDTILKIDGHTVYMITDYMDALDGKSAGENVDVLVLRDGVQRTVRMPLVVDADFVNMSDVKTLYHSMGIYGLSPTAVKQNFFETIGNSFGYSVKIGGTVLRSLGELLTGKLGLDAMGGPITTIKVTSQAATSGVFSLLEIAALIGVNLAVFNLLPVPALDGCKVIFCLIEWIRKKPVNRKVETMIHFVGIIALFGFAILVDLLQLF